MVVTRAISVRTVALFTWFDDTVAAHREGANCFSSAQAFMEEVANISVVLGDRARAPVNFDLAVSRGGHNLTSLITSISIDPIVAESELVTDFVRDGDGVAL